MSRTRSHVEMKTGVERERLERLVGSGPPCAPVILIKTLVDTKAAPGEVGGKQACYLGALMVW